MNVTPETPDDIAGIAALHRTAFGGAYEAGVVAGLRDGGFVVASLLVREDSVVVGHVLWSRIDLQTPTEPVPTVALAPLAVAASHRRRGIGDALVRAGIAASRDAGFRVGAVLGDPRYYSRFGFAPTPLATPYRPGAVMTLSLDGSPLPAEGRLRYPPPFTRAQAG